jgi:hypothetical protein
MPTRDARRRMSGEPGHLTDVRECPAERLSQKAG